MVEVVTGVVLAGFAAITNSGATVLEALAADDFAKARWGSVPLYALGLILDLLGWLLTLAALRFLPIFAVQSIVAEQVAITVLVAGRVFGSLVRPRDLAAAGATVVGLAAIAASAATTAPPPPSIGLMPILAGMVGLGALVGLALSRRGLWLGATILAGTCFSAAAVVARGLHPRATSADTALTVLLDPAVWAMLALGLLGTALYIWALARGRPGAVLAVLSVTEVVLPGAVGVALLGDSVRHGWALPCLLGLAAALAGTTGLALSPGARRVSGHRPTRTGPPGLGGEPSAGHRAQHVATAHDADQATVVNDRHRPDP